MGSEIQSKNNAIGLINIIHSNFKRAVFVNNIGETKNKNCIKLFIIIWTSRNRVHINDSEIHIGNKKNNNNKKENKENKKYK